jgi:hypothetical protein
VVNCLFILFAQAAPTFNVLFQIVFLKVICIIIIIIIIIIVVVVVVIARCSTMANKVYQFMDVFSTKTISLDDCVILLSLNIF